jgi:hypothetical protein
MILSVPADTSSKCDLLVNEFGCYAGDERLPNGTLVLEVIADGPWTLAPAERAGMGYGFARE